MLLAACSLPPDGLAEQFGPQYVVAEEGDSLIGIAGVELYGDAGLLRSVAVAPALQGSGLGAALLHDRLQWSSRQGLRQLYLLTIGAAGYFARHGFTTTARDVAPETIRASTQFVHACPASAVLMVCNTLPA